MTSVLAVFPVLRGTRRFFIEKGRRWSIVEHLLLDAVAKAEFSAAELSVKSSLPKRIVVEAIIRLMRAGWVEIHTTSNGPVFRATSLGILRAGFEQLPSTTVTEPKWRGFVIEQVTGGVFRSRELDDVRPYSRLPVSNEDQIVVHLDRVILASAGDLGEIFAAIEGEDELIVGIDRAPERLIERYAVVTVREGGIEGLPSRASLKLRALIWDKAQRAWEARGSQLVNTSAVKETSLPSVPIVNREVEAGPVSALFDSGDLIFDAEEHRDSLEELIGSATERIIIHSTFITDMRAQALLPLFLQAGSRGVSVDVLWGQDDVGSSPNTSSVAAGKIQAVIENEGRGESIKVHQFSTNSHAKIAVADNGRGGWSALVGSCNWLATDFESFEVSVRLRDPVMVGRLVTKLGGLSRGRPGVWTNLAVEMTVLGRRICGVPRGAGRTAPMRILFGADHARLVLEARDRAKKRIFVLSHRIGISARAMALLPALAAARANGVESTFYYGRTTGPLTGVGSADLIREFSREGISITPVHKPRLHAKVLGWDDDNLAVSSLNWLSADPSDASPGREIGVTIEASRLADNFFRRFELSRDH